MKKYKVICLTSGATEPPQSDDMETAIEEAAREGWNFVNFTTGGGGSGNGNVTSWVYLLFVREI